MPAQVPSHGERALDWQPADVGRLRGLITAYSGLDAATWSDEVLQRAVARRLAALGLPRLGGYWSLLRPDPAAGGELRHLVQLLTNNETFFFREMHHFDLLRRHLLPDLRRRGRPLRLWSAGCATGEEAYSLAILLLEEGLEGRVLGTDIDAEALDAARRGCYEERSLRLVPPPWRQRYLEPHGQRQCVVPALSRLVSFQLHNLAETCCPEAMSGMDVIFCRNVTIYFEAQARKRLNARLAGSLAEGGYLFVASAETMGHNQGRLELVPLEGAFVFRKGAPVARPPAAPQPEPRPATRRSPRPLEPAPLPRPAPSPDLAVAAALFQEHSFDQALLVLDRLPAETAALSEARCLRAAILVQQAHLDAAEAICRDLVAGDPWQADGYLLWGLIHRQRGHAELALQALKQAVYLRPSHRRAHFFLAEVYRALGLLDLARREYENSLNVLRGGPPVLDVAGLGDEMVRRACELNLGRLRPGGRST